MNKLFISLSFLAAMQFVNAQVGINTTTPDASSALDIHSESKGILIPRFELSSKSQQLSTVPNADGLMVYHTGNATMSKGFYYWNGTSWLAVANENMVGGVSPAQRMFYMPAVAIDTRENVQGVKMNLYNEYVAQFTNKDIVPDNNGGTLGTGTSGTFVKSTTAPNTIPVISSASELYYYITYYDKTALANLSIDDNGILTFDVVGTGTDYSFINIIFVIK